MVEPSSILKLLNRCYNLRFEDIFLHRAMIGYVYFIKNSKHRYVLKLYRHFNTEQALQSIEIIQYLKTSAYPVVSIVPTESGSSYITLSVPEGQCIGILFEFIEGIEPNLESEIVNVGKQIGNLHDIMDRYPGSLINRGKEFYVDRYITILQKLGYPQEKIKELAEYGREIWRNIEKGPRGFCHGDLHSGNMLKTKSNEFVLFDFDIASNSHPIIDVSTLSNKTGFNQLEKSAYDCTMKMFDRFYQGYSQKRSLSDVEIASIFDFVAVRHYELIATITDCQGLDSLDESFIDQQYDWLMKWRTICSR